MGGSQCRTGGPHRSRADQFLRSGSVYIRGAGQVGHFLKLPLAYFSGFGSLRTTVMVMAIV